MNIQTCTMDSFTVIGLEGSTAEGPGFIQQLWTRANAGFSEIAHLARRDEAGRLLGIWGAMSDMSRTFGPWEDGFTKGLYLAGLQAEDGAQAPAGWTAWRIPAFEYLYVENTGGSCFSEVISHMEQEGIELAGAVQEFFCPEEGLNYLFFPIRRL